MSLCSHDDPFGVRLTADEHNERVVIEALDRLRQSYGCAVLVVTHAERVAAAVDRVIELRDGRIAPAA